MTKDKPVSRLSEVRSKRSPVTRAYGSAVLRTVHETAEGLYEAGVMDKKTMRHFDETCLTPIKRLTARQIAALRKREEVSQSVFARYLGLSVTLISQWERGEKKPQGASLKLLTLVEKNGLDFVA